MKSHHQIQLLQKPDLFLHHNNLRDFQRVRPQLDPDTGENGLCPSLSEHVPLPVPVDMDSHLYSVSQPYAVAARPVHMVLRYVYFSKVLLLQPWYYLYLYSLASSANFGSAFTIVSYATQYAILTYPGHPKELPGTIRILYFFAVLQNSFSSATGDFTKR